MELCDNSNVKWCWNVCYFLLVCHAFILPNPVESLIDLLKPLPTFTKTVYEAEVPRDQPLNSTILTLKTRDRGANPQLFYGEEVIYVLINETTEDHYQAIFATPTYVPTNVTTTEWVKSYLTKEYSGVRQRRYLAIDSQSGAVRLRKPLDIIGVGRITARVLIVDFRSPIVKEIVTLVVTVKAIPPPLNVTVDSVTDISARVCWLWSSSGPLDGFIVEVEALVNGSRHIHSVAATNESASVCVCIKVVPGSDHELWVYGHNDGIAGLSSDRVFFTTHVTRKIVCEKGLHEPRIYHRAPAGKHVTFVKAHDEISSQPIIYRLATGDDTFSINETSGQLTTAVRITKNISDYYSVSVMATSGPQVELCPIQIKVTQRNSNGPEFSQRSYGSDVPYYQQPATTIGTVNARKDDVTEPHNNKDIYYLITELNIKEHSGLTIHEVDLPHLSSSKTWLADDMVMMYGETDNKYLAIDRASGAVYLKNNLDVNVSRIVATVLAVDDGSPSHYDYAYVTVSVVTIGPPLNVTVTNVTEVNARVCWRRPTFGHVKGFVVQVETSKDRPIHNHTIELSQSSSEEPFCTYVGLERAIQHRLWVYGYNEKIVGLNSRQIIINVMNQQTFDDQPCLNN